MLKKLIITLVSIVPFLSEGQSFYAIRRPRNVIVSGGTGTAMYMGEMVNPKQVGKVRYNIVAGAEYMISGRLTTKAELIWFNVAGTDEIANDDRKERNLSFTSNNQELSLQAVYHLFPETKLFYQRKSMNAYAFAGVGVLHMNPKAEYEGRKYALQPLQTEGVKYSQFQVVIPYGIGVKFMVNPLYNIAIEGGYRSLFTDYMDDVSSERYTDPATLNGGINGLSAKLSDRRKERDPDYPLDYTRGVRGNPNQNDGYILINIKFQYYLPKMIGPDAEHKKFYRKKRKGFNSQRR